MISADDPETEVERLLDEAEELEERAATERVAYFSGLFSDGRRGKLLDVGCGNGYAVRDWAERGIDAVGVDRSLYRLSRWVAVHPDRRRRLVIADAAALPFPDGTFDRVVSSGMIEHVGVEEASAPYRVRALPDRDGQRGRVVSEIARVAGASSTVVIDCPNGAFPIDFWHGDRVGAFRVHGVPDVLLPTFGDLRRWAAAAGCRVVVRPLSGRLAFRQVGSHWWGRALAPLMRLFLSMLDVATRCGLGWLTARLYPYLVVEFRQPDTI